MAKLNLYEDEDGSESVAIITSSEFETEAKDYGLKLIYTVELDGDFTSWPTDRFLTQD